MVWLAFLQIVLVTVDVPAFEQYLIYGHTTLGLAILALAHYDNMHIKRTSAPNRLKRIAKATAILATIQPILGGVILLNLMRVLDVPLVGVITFLHIVIALAIITQAASVATAYDMWEDEEYTKQ